MQFLARHSHRPPANWEPRLGAVFWRGADPCGYTPNCWPTATRSRRAQRGSCGPLPALSPFPPIISTRCTTSPWSGSRRTTTRPCPRMRRPTQLGTSPHTDYGVITLLWQDDRGGLELRHRSGSWHPATPKPGIFVVNIGDLLARWTNDRFVSTAHRVRNISGLERLSLAASTIPTRTPWSSASNRAASRVPHRVIRSRRAGSTFDHDSTRCSHIASRATLETVRGALDVLGRRASMRATTISCDRTMMIFWPPTPDMSSTSREWHRSEEDDGVLAHVGLSLIGTGAGTWTLAGIGLRPESPVQPGLIAFHRVGHHQSIVVG